MGNEKSSDLLLVPSNCKLYSTMALTSPQQQQYIRQILKKRGAFFLNEHICTVSEFQFLSVDSDKISCQQSRQLVIFYDSFDHILSDIPLHQYSFMEHDIYRLLYCLTDALRFLKSLNHCHGDISLRNICKKGSLWKLIDKTFIKNGVTAYERVLEGEQGFISPEQMERIRYGFIRQSPPTTESDDIFALGMVLLQVASSKPSLSCYKQSFIRFNEDHIEDHLKIVQAKFGKKLANIIAGMIQLDHEKRLTLDELLNFPSIRTNAKHSLKLMNLQTQQRSSRNSMRNSSISSTMQQTPMGRSQLMEEQKGEHRSCLPKKYSFAGKR